MPWEQTAPVERFVYAHNLHQKETTKTSPNNLALDRINFVCDIDDV